MLHTRNAVGRYDSPLPIRTDPERRMDFLLRDYLTLKNVAHEQVVVHRLRNDLGDCRRVKFDEAVVFRAAGLVEKDQRPMSVCGINAHLPFCCAKDAGG